ncbi:PREDICTED: UV-B-induced protein At3g17800, chloroplastic-like [Nicotiana attenuata]|uniref:Uv-b-induced protein, chloroplastic n=1 Tax=Nicotiana attenuata TaxID=49451 RepID=A0A1J6IPJ2_NICAT|nr:PREDICTED: UV-B-induced protein At3g17800, chloroplastic-like [Nicotiana attenuata]XP_019255922.1 PREDICTED: UV-B-induced protein At3g17800, chloroplastic-like [Nicotiana attenuata]OIS97072.1 uv-b-induced protein, chloroplastic [Nicotiana attenuata]OIT18692.1 uv-b-induced protein, chloroplastic [Nicotiana attenuata]
MDCGFFYTDISLPQSLPFTVKNTLFSSIPFSPLNLQSTLFKSRKSLVVVASGKNSSNNCEFSGLNVPLVPRTEEGRFLSSIFQNNKKCFYAVVQKELAKLGYEKGEAFLRMNLNLGSDEAVLHRRIAELKKLECRNAVEDILYMLIVYKFSEIGVHLVPKLSKCMYNGRLEIWPCRDWELESIHSFEVLEMVREHLTTVIGWKEKSNVTENWIPTQVPKFQIHRVYAASILYGYFLKSASLRHHMEQSLEHINSDIGVTTSGNLLVSGSWPLKQNSVPFGRISGTRSTLVGPTSLIQGKKNEKLRSYVMNFDHEIMQMCAKPKCKEALNLIEKHCSALFGDESDEVVSTSLASLKRIVLEAVAFGSFLWDAEDYVRTFYQLEEN